jgi:protein arginine kinase activator
MSFAEISKTGRVGCGNCYKIFGKELMPTLVRIHGRSTHVGKGVQTVDGITDKAPNSQETAENKVDTLKKELQKAIETEEYEKAAELRDQIRRAEGK